MARYRSSNRLRPVHRLKHIVDAEGSVDDTPIVVVPLVKGADAPVIASQPQVITGSHVYGMYLHVEVSHTSGTGRPNIYMIVYKNPGANLSNTSFVPKGMGATDLKRHVIHQEMILMSGDAGNGLPRPLFNGVIKVPGAMSRIGPGDEINMNIVTGNAGIVADWCLQAHFKEFR